MQYVCPKLTSLITEPYIQQFSGHFHLDKFNTVNSSTSFFIKYIDEVNYCWESKPENKDRMGRRLMDFIAHILLSGKYIYIDYFYRILKMLMVDYE